LKFNELIKLIETFEGIIGAIFGSAITLLITHWLKNQGKIFIELIEFNKTYSKKDGAGAYNMLTETLEEAGYAQLDISINVYNSSENIKTLYDINYKLLDENNDVMGTGELKDISTVSKTAGANRYEMFTFINCKPKELFNKELRVNFSPSNILLLSISKKLVLNFKLKKTTLLSRIWNRPIKVTIQL
jgi:hypothetical protein